ncbi:MAG: ribosome biogenesis GTPase Der [Lentisphaeria bacterium]|nr:ribosome biogenesis GTPase Der [Lentisphaeria bacterium]
MTQAGQNGAAALPVVAIVGRPNVGKSSLFNTIIGRRMSIVHEQSGVTRDRVITQTSFRGCDFQLVDTGGLGMLDGEQRGVDIWDQRIARQAEVAVADADLLILVTDVEAGVVPLDREVVARLRRTGKPVLVAVNKCDNPGRVEEMAEFSELGFPKLFPVSCLHRNGIQALLDAAVALLPEKRAAEPVTVEPAVKPFRIAVAGRPNVGKSSLVNALLGTDRVIVSDVAGTTRDAVDVDFSFEYKGEQCPAVLVDTAGLRRRGKVDTVVEYFSVMRASAAINRADMVLMVVEADPAGMTAQDRRIAAIIEESGRGCVVVANKFDLQADEHTVRDLEAELRRTLSGMNYAPVVFVSAREKRNLGMLLDRIAEVRESLEQEITTSHLNRVLGDAFMSRTPPVVGNAPLKFYYASVIGTAPFRVLMFVNDPRYCADNYLIYLKNMLRNAFGLTGVPIDLKLRARPKKMESIHTPSRSRTPRRSKN